jgi:hypothetical protein
VRRPGHKQAWQQQCDDRRRSHRDDQRLRELALPPRELTLTHQRIENQPVHARPNRSRHQQDGTARNGDRPTRARHCEQRSHDGLSTVPTHGHVVGLELDEESDLRTHVTQQTNTDCQPASDVCAKDVAVMAALQMSGLVCNERIKSSAG